MVPFFITSPFLLPAFIPSWKQINNSPFLRFGYFKMLSNENICSSFLWLAFQHNSLDFIQTTGWINTSSLFTAVYYSMIHMFHGLFNHLSVEGHLSCFQFTVIMNKTAINTLIQICMWTQVFISLDKCPGVQQQSCMIIWFFFFLKKPLNCFPEWLNNFISNVWIIWFLHILPAFWHFHYFLF